MTGFGFLAHEHHNDGQHHERDRADLGDQHDVLSVRIVLWSSDIKLVVTFVDVLHQHRTFLTGGHLLYQCTGIVVAEFHGTEFGIVMLVRPVQPENAWISMLVTEFGIVMLVSPVQP